MYGQIDVICGPMFSGKTTELILRADKYMRAGVVVQVFKPAIDNRYSIDQVESHAGQSLAASPVALAEDILGLVKEEAGLIVIDEAQFFDDRLVLVCQSLARKCSRVFVAGLDMDFRGQPFGPMPQLLAIADSVDKLVGVCKVCHEPAHFSQRLIDGRPAPSTAPKVLLGASELYQPRCREHHLVPTV